jgi:hypothetical protein
MDWPDYDQQKTFAISQRSAENASYTATLTANRVSFSLVMGKVAVHVDRVYLTSFSCYTLFSSYLGTPLHLNHNSNVAVPTVTLLEFVPFVSLGSLKPHPPHSTAYFKTCYMYLPVQ